MKINEIIVEVTNPDTGTTNPDTPSQKSLAKRALGWAGKAAKGVGGTMAQAASRLGHEALGLHYQAPHERHGYVSPKQQEWERYWAQKRAEAEKYAQDEKSRQAAVAPSIPVYPGQRLVVSLTGSPAQPTHYKTASGWFNMHGQPMKDPASVQKMDQLAIDQLEKGVARVEDLPKPQQRGRGRRRQ